MPMLELVFEKDGRDVNFMNPDSLLTYEQEYAYFLRSLGARLSEVNMADIRARRYFLAV